jgi:hypothetical protein
MTDADSRGKGFDLYSKPPKSTTSYPFYDPALSLNQVELTPREDIISSRSLGKLEPLSRLQQVPPRTPKPRQPVNLNIPPLSYRPPQQQQQQQPPIQRQPQPALVVQKVEPARPVAQQSVYKYQPQRESDLTDWPHSFSYKFCNCCEDFRLCFIGFFLLPWLEITF